MSDGSTDGYKTPQGVDNGIRCQVFQHLNVDSSGAKTGEKEAIALVHFTTLFGLERAKAIHATISKWWGGIGAINREVCHPLLFCWATRSPAGDTLPHILGHCLAATNYPVTISPYFIQGLPSALVLSFFMKVGKNEASNSTVFWKT